MRGAPTATSLTYKPVNAEVFDDPIHTLGRRQGSPNTPVPAFMARDTVQDRAGLASSSRRPLPTNAWGPAVPAGKPTHPPGTSAPVPKGTVKSRVSVRDLHAGLTKTVIPNKYLQYRQAYDKLAVHELVDGSQTTPQIDTTRPARLMARLDVSDIPGTSPRKHVRTMTAEEMASRPLGRSLKTSDITGATPVTYVGKKIPSAKERRLYPQLTLPRATKQDSFGKQQPNKDYHRFRSAGPRALFPTVQRVTVLKRPPVLRGAD